MPVGVPSDAVHRRPALPAETLRAEPVPEPGRGRRALQDLRIAAVLSRSSEKVPSSPQCTQSRLPSADRSTSDGTPARFDARRRRRPAAVPCEPAASWSAWWSPTAMVSRDPVGSGMTPWSVGASGTLAERRRLGERDGVSLSSSRMARLRMKPNATTSSTPARITEAGMRYSLIRRCAASASSADGTVAARRRPLLRYPDTGYGERGRPTESGWRPVMRSSSGTDPPGRTRAHAAGLPVAAVRRREPDQAVCRCRR